MKHLIVLLVAAFAMNAQAAQINLDCKNVDGELVASVYTPTFVYSQCQLKVEAEVEGMAISFDAPLRPSSEIPGIYVSGNEEFTAVGISENSPFAHDARMQIDILQHGMSIMKLSCETTVHNPAFPRD